MTELPGNDMTYQEMHDFFKSDAFRQPCEMCIRRQASFQSFSDKAEVKALASGVIANNWMDIEALMASVGTDPDAANVVGNDAELNRIVEKVWPYVALARYPQLAGIVVNYPPEVFLDAAGRTLPDIPKGMLPDVGVLNEFSPPED